jgi:hypothetical protein
MLRTKAIALRSPMLWCYAVLQPGTASNFSNIRIYFISFPYFENNIPVLYLAQWLKRVYSDIFA